MDLLTANQKLNDRLNELRACCATGSPWVFVGASAFLEYLTKLAGRTGSQGYKDFVSDELEKVNGFYRSFRYRNGAQDLPTQMYHVLRCGIVHSLSLVPDARAVAAGGRDRSIVLCHAQEARSKKLSHLGNYTGGGLDAALFVAEDFVDDLQKVTAQLFTSAAQGSAQTATMKAQLQNHPFISAGY